MMIDFGKLRLAMLPLSARVVITGFVTVALTGYLIALLNMYLTYAQADGKPGLTPQDVRHKIYGDRSGSKLESALNGNMGQFLKSGDQKTAILEWVHNGAAEPGFRSVQPIFDQQCVSCHKSGGAAGFRPLTNFKEVAIVAQVDTGESLATFARVAHTHLQSLAMIYFGLGILFAFVGLPDRLKALVGAIPFIALALDFGTRGLIRFWPEMVYPMMASGGIAGAATSIMVVCILWEVWLAGRGRPMITQPLPAPSPAGAE